MCIIKSGRRESLISEKTHESIKLKKKNKQTYESIKLKKKTNSTIECNIRKLFCTYYIFLYDFLWT